MKTMLQDDAVKNTQLLSGTLVNIKWMSLLEYNSGVENVSVVHPGKSRVSPSVIQLAFRDVKTFANFYLQTSAASSH